MSTLDFDTSFSAQVIRAAPAFSICHATARTNPDGWSASRNAWLLNADNPGAVEYILSVHDTDAVDKEMLSFGNNRLCIYDGARNSVHGWNVAADASTGHIIILNADDFFPPEHWDSKLLMRCATLTYPEHEFAMHVSTGTPDVDWDRRLMALGIISRPLYKRWGYALYPEYESMESDVDMLEHAIHDGVLIQAYDLVFEHRHVSLGKSPDDEVYRWQNRPEAYALGREVIARRRLDGFSK